jgi:signal transduction histidine kinase
MTNMPEDQPNFLRRALRNIILRLLELSSFRFAVLFLVVAVAVSVAIVLTIDLLWDGRLSAELEFAGVVTPFLDGLFIVIFVVAMLDEIRKEGQRRKQLEDRILKLNEELDREVQERTRQLLEAQEELVHREKLAVLGRVADTVGHELRNPLGVMNNAVYYLQTVLSGADETTREYLGIIKDEIGEADRIVSDLLDAVRTKPPRLAVVEIAEVVEHTLRKCDIPPSVSVSLGIPAVLPPVLADPMQLHQVFWNLAANALEAMPDGGMLAIRAAENTAEGYVAVTVRDTGAGMSAEQLSHLFQPLYTTKARRVGLGLVVVKKLTEANGGSVSVESEPGKGSTFVVTLPAAR